MAYLDPGRGLRPADLAGGDMWRIREPELSICSLYPGIADLLSSLARPGWYPDELVEDGG